MPSGVFAVANNSAGLSTEIRWRTTDDAANNRSTFIVELWAIRSSATTFGDGSFVLRIGNDATVNDGGVAVGTSWVRVVSRSRVVNHNADGSLSISVGVVSGGKPGTSWTSTSGTQTVSGTNYVRTPSAPSTPTVSSTDTDRVSLAWNAPSDTAGGILEYQLQRASNSGFTSGVSTISTGTTRSGTHTGLSPNTTYWFRVRARSGDGWGSWSSSRSATTNVALPSAPGTPTASGVGPTGVSLAWSAPSNSGGGSISEYRVQRATNSEFTTGVVLTSGIGTRDLGVSGLTPSTDYWFRVAARNEAGWGPYSSARQVRTLDSAFESVNDEWVPVEISASNDVSWSPVEILSSDGTDWLTAS